MAKISTYPLDGSPNLGDKLIGTDINDLNATKNYTIGQILSVPGSSAYVPYTGATGNVNLGSNNLTVNDITAGDVTGTSFVKIGGLSTQFLKADGSVDSNTYLTTTAAAATYVPYTGATGNVNLGNNDLEGDILTANLELHTNEIHQIGAGNISTYDSTSNQLGWLVNFSQQKVRIGDFNGITTGTELVVDYNNQWVEIASGALRVSGSVGTSGQVLKSQGAGLAPQWGAEVIPTIDQVLAAGNTATNKNMVMTTSGGTLTLDGTGVPSLNVSGTVGLDNVTTIVSCAGVFIDNSTANRLVEIKEDFTVTYTSGTATLETYANPANFNNNALTYPSGNGTFAISVNGVAAASTGNVELYKEYVALISRSGPGVVTATVLKNTLGTTVTWGNPSNGLLTALAALPVFTSGKTWMSSGSYNDGGTPYFITAEESIFSPGDELLYNIFLHDGTQAGTPNINNFSIEIRVYP